MSNVVSSNFLVLSTLILISTPMLVVLALTGLVSALWFTIDQGRDHLARGYGHVVVSFDTVGRGALARCLVEFQGEDYEFALDPRESPLVPGEPVAVEYHVERFSRRLWVAGCSTLAPTPSCASGSGSGP